MSGLLKTTSAVIGPADGNLPGMTYSTASSQSIPNATDTIINFDTLEYDSTGGCVTTGASWKFTPKKPGFYKIDTNIVIAAAAFSSFRVWLYKNGSQSKRVSYGAVDRGNASFNVYLTVGDYIDIRLFANASGTTLSANALDNWISIVRMGF